MKIEDLIKKGHFYALEKFRDFLKHSFLITILTYVLMDLCPCFNNVVQMDKYVHK